MPTVALPSPSLPLPEQYEDTQEYLRALVVALEEQLGAALTTLSNNSGSLERPVTDSSGRDIITDDGIIIYNGVGTPVVNENLVQIDTSELADTAVTTAKLADLSVDTAKLAALAVDASKLAASSVEADKIANLAVGTAAIANAAVGTAQIANLAVTEGLIGNLAVVEGKIADLAVTDAKINTVSANKLTAGTIDASVINVNNINASNISSGTLNTSRLNLDGVGIVNNAGTIEIGTVNNTDIATGLSASKITTGTLNASLATITNINASNISTGTLSADRVNIDNVTLDTSGGQLIIKTAGVDTSQLATNSATISTQVRSASYAITSDFSSTEVTVQSATISNTDGSYDVRVDFTSLFDRTAGDNPRFYFYLYRDTTLVYGGDSGSVVGLIGHIDTANRNYPLSLTYTDSPTAGTYTYYLKVKSTQTTQRYTFWEPTILLTQLIR